MAQVIRLSGKTISSSMLEERFDERNTAGLIDAEEAIQFALRVMKDRTVTYIIIDALDECDQETRSDLIENLKRILAKAESVVKIFLTSRDDRPGAKRALASFPEIGILGSSNREDIEKYVHHQLDVAISRGKLLAGQDVSDELRTEIQDSLCNGADGM
jgi:DNA-binding NarL/FixJ family response regulator